MKDILIDTIYNGERYKVPYSEMGSWRAYIIDLSYFTLDAGHLQIEFTDAFNKYRV
jgi:hypothetical protein